MHRSPRELYYRSILELRAATGRFTKSPLQKLTNIEFIELFGFTTVDDYWEDLSMRPFATDHSLLNERILVENIPDEFERIIGLADQALEWKIDLLGTGLIFLRENQRWTTDFKVGLGWPMIYFRDIDILNLEQPSDVKIPWEISRMHWLIPVAQAYKLTGDKKYALFCREVIEDWIRANPYGKGVNWTIAMEPAMRIFCWTWLFHIFKHSLEWSNPSFQILFLRSLYEQGIFVERYIENFGINGNHFTADAAGLVFAGLFFGGDARAQRWAKLGWNTLLTEISRQILNDGVDFEGSIAYHRFVSELFFWPARFRQVVGKEIPSHYSDRLLLMADFIECYTKPNGQAPLWGDADDARVLPFGGQGHNDHSYLPDLIRLQWGDNKSQCSSPKAKAEVLWSHGIYDDSLSKKNKPVSRGFEKSGFYIMANDEDHVFIDCGPVGFSGKGGHGHNDCLSFEAVLCGVPIVSDRGTYIYSGSYQKRNEYRSTRAHNTPIIDGVEQNRLLSKNELFSLKNDAIPSVRSWQIGDDIDIFIGSHSGYHKLKKPVTPVRMIALEKRAHRLIVRDEFKGEGEHEIMIPLHLASYFQVKQIDHRTWLVSSGKNIFNLIVSGSTEWSVTIKGGKISPSYGKLVESTSIEFVNEGPLETLLIGIYPENESPEYPEKWLRNYL